MGVADLERLTTALSISSMKKKKENHEKFGLLS